MWFKKRHYYCHIDSAWLLAVSTGLWHPADGRRWYVFKNAKWHLMFSVAACFPDPGWTWPSAPLVRWSYAFGSAQSRSIGLHLKGHPVLSDFSLPPLEKPRQWHYKNSNMLRKREKGGAVCCVGRNEWNGGRGTTITTSCLASSQILSHYGWNHFRNVEN